MAKRTTRAKAKTSPRSFEIPDLLNRDAIHQRLADAGLGEDEQRYFCDVLTAALCAPPRGNEWKVFRFFAAAERRRHAERADVLRPTAPELSVELALDLDELAVQDEGRALDTVREAVGLATKALKKTGKLKEDVDLGPLRDFLLQVLKSDRCYSRSLLQRVKAHAEVKIATAYAAGFDRAFGMAEAHGDARQRFLTTSADLWEPVNTATREARSSRSSFGSSGADEAFFWAFVARMLDVDPNADREAMNVGDYFVSRAIDLLIEGLAAHLGAGSPLARVYDEVAQLFTLAGLQGWTGDRVGSRHRKRRIDSVAPAEA